MVVAAVVVVAEVAAAEVALERLADAAGEVSLPGPVEEHVATAEDGAEKDPYSS